LGLVNVKPVKPFENQLGRTARPAKTSKPTNICESLYHINYTMFNFSSEKLLFYSFPPEQTALEDPSGTS